MHQQRRLAGGGWALERCRGDADDDAAAFEVSEHFAAGERAVARVELVPALEQSRRCLGVEVGAQCDDEDVGFEPPALVSTTFATGSIPVTLACTNWTPGFTRSA